MKILPLLKYRMNTVIMTIITCISLSMVTTSFGWHRHYNHYHRYHRYHRYHHNYHYNDNAAGLLVVAGVAGIIAGAAIAQNSQPATTYSYNQPAPCIQGRVVSHTHFWRNGVEYEKTGYQNCYN